MNLIVNKQLNLLLPTDLLRTATDLQIKGLASVAGERPTPAPDPDLHPYPSPPLSTPSKGPPAALLSTARPLGGLPSALNLSGPPPPAVLDTLRLPLLSKVRPHAPGGRLLSERGGGQLR